MTNPILNMSAAVPVDAFVERLKASGLLRDDDVKKSLAQCPAKPNDSDGGDYAKSLVANGWLTPFQATAISEGRLPDLRLGNYDLLDRLGSGGMGTVYRARHRRMKRVVAIKVLSLSLNENKTFLQRFQREVEAVARLNHPNIIVAHDADVAEQGHYLVMEYVRGADLDRLVRIRGPLSPRLAAALILQAASGLEYAHSQGIVHRDVKPANLLVAESGVVKVTDLGLARADAVFGNDGLSDPALTRAGGILGTVDYMPPEQAFNPSQVDHRVDIYGLGCTLYYLLMGRPPFSGETPMETLLHHRQNPVPSLLKQHPDASLDLDDIFQRMMAKMPVDRFSSMSALILALKEPGLTLSNTELKSEPALKDLAGMFSQSSSPGTDRTWSTPTLDSQWTPRESELVPIEDFKGKRQDLTVLLADSSRTVRAFVRQAMQQLGFARFLEVGDGVQSFEAMQQQKVDLVVTGFNLARLDGAGLISQVRKNSGLSKTPILVVTTESDPDKLNSVRTAGATAIIDKSFPLDIVRTIFDRLFPPSAAAPSR